MKYIVWISNAKDIVDVLDPMNDLLIYEARTWDEAMELFRQSLDQGYTCIMCKEE